MAATKLTSDQREYLLELLAAEYDTPTVFSFMRQTDAPDITRQTLHFYRKKYGEVITAAKVRRRSEAADRGVANHAERIARLAQHADALERIKWKPDPVSGRLWNEKAWRETLHQIAEEMGDLKQIHELSGANGEPLMDPKMAAVMTELARRLGQ